MEVFAILRVILQNLKKKIFSEQRKLGLHVGFGCIFAASPPELCGQWLHLSKQLKWKMNADTPSELWWAAVWSC